MPSFLGVLRDAVLEFVIPDSVVTRHHYEVVDSTSRRPPSEQLLSRTSENFASNPVIWSHAVTSSRRNRHQSSTVPHPETTTPSSRAPASLSPDAQPFTPTFESITAATSSSVDSTSTANASLQDLPPRSTASTSTRISTSPSASSKHNEILLQKKIDQLVAKETAAVKREDSLRRTNQDANNEIDRLKKLNARLESSNQELSIQKKTMEKVQLELLARLEHSEAHSRRLETHLSDVEALKALSDRSLAELRQFITIKDSGDIAELVQKVDDYNESIDEVAYRLSELVTDPSTILDAPSVLGTLASIPHGAGTVVADVVDLRSLREITKEGLFFQTFKATLHCFLYDELWKHFHIFENTSSSLAAVHQAMRETEPQAVHARWRSLGYATLNRLVEVDFDHRVEQATQIIWRMIEPLCLAFLDNSSISADSNGDHFKQLSSILSDALKLHKILKEDYLSADFSILFPSPGTPFDSHLMIDASDESEESTKGKAEKSTATVAGVVGVGLLKSSMQTMEKGERVERTEIVTKPVVLTSEWLADRA